jgi:hypothetical protein
MTTMKNDPKQIAEHLLETLGDDGAWQKVREGVAAALEDEDNYTLSVWREIRRAIEIKLAVGEKKEDLSC